MCWLTCTAPASEAAGSPTPGPTSLFSQLLAHLGALPPRHRADVALDHAPQPWLPQVGQAHLAVGGDERLPQAGGAEQQRALVLGGIPTVQLRTGTN